MALPRLPLSPDAIPTFWAASIGYAIATIIACILLGQLLYVYIKMFVSKPTDTNHHHPSPSKTPYILVILYLTLSLIISIIFLSLESNLFTLFTPQKFTKLRCTIAFLLWPSLTTINQGVLSVIFLHRVYMTFKDSAFEYNPWIYRIFLFVITIIFPCSLIAVNVMIINSIKTAARYDPATNLTFCAFDSLSQDMEFQIATIVVVGVIVISQAITSAGLLALFLRGLCKLSKELMLHFMENNSRTKPRSVPGPQLHLAIKTHSELNSQSITKETSTDDQSINGEIEGGHQKAKISVDRVLSAWQRESTITRNQTLPELERIMQLHNLIKKQAILACISIVSSMTWGISIGFDFDFLLLSGWDLIVNMICVWMMLITSKTYWNGCRKYGLCMCCYWKVNKMGL